MNININDKAPDFTLHDENGNDVSLKTLRGQVVVLYFYPRADTPGCTVEACAFRDTYKQIQKTGAVLLGISPDTSKAQKKFQEKFQTAVSPARRCRQESCRSLRCRAGKKHVRQESDGYCPNHVRHRTRRQNPAHLPQSKARRPCG